MYYRSLVIAVVLVSAASTHGQSRCGAAKDSVVQAREKARPGLSRQELQEQRLQLIRASDLCSSLGDSYYYRYLYSRELGITKDVNYLLQKARENGSEALGYGADPFAAGPQRATSSFSPNVREKWALIVGVSTYSHGITPLRFPAKDARDFADVLLNPNWGRFKPENVRVLTDEKATTKNIKEGLNWLARNAEKDDLAVVFVSSHGSPRELDTGGVSYVITSDTDASNPDSLYATALEMIEIVDALSTRVRAQRGVLFLDTCFSGAVSSGMKPLSSRSVSSVPDRETMNPDRLSRAGSKALVAEGAGISNAALNRIEYSVGRIVITASQPDERSWESENFRNGYFTHSLIEGLKEDNGKITIDRVFERLRSEVSRQVLADKKVSQIPMMLPATPSVSITLGAQAQ